MTRTTSGVTRCVSIQWQANLKDCKKSKCEFGAFPLTALSEWTQLRKVSAAWLQRSTNQDIKMKRESSGITSNRRVCNCSRSSASVGHVARCLMMTQTRNSWSVTWWEIFCVDTWGCVAGSTCGVKSRRAELQIITYQCNIQASAYFYPRSSLMSSCSRWISSLHVGKKGWKENKGLVFISGMKCVFVCLTTGLPIVLQLHKSDT